MDGLPSAIETASTALGDTSANPEFNTIAGVRAGFGYKLSLHVADAVFSDALKCEVTREPGCQRFDYQQNRSVHWHHNNKRFNLRGDYYAS
ncbi:MAG: hypothetical protein VYE18_02840 [Pseudomonadota bacterium]|nr:hypothetical protein [Pseudomonadota bacterium]